MRDEKCMILGQSSKEAERARATLPAERSLGIVLGKLFIWKRQTFLVSCVGERMWVDGLSVFDGDMHMLFVSSGLVSGELG